MKKILSILLVVMSVPGIYECSAQSSGVFPIFAKSVIRDEKRFVNDEARVQRNADIIANMWLSDKGRELILQQVRSLLSHARSVNVAVDVSNGRTVRRYKGPAVVDVQKKEDLLNLLKSALEAKSLPNFKDLWEYILAAGTTL